MNIRTGVRSLPTGIAIAALLAAVGTVTPAEALLTPAELQCRAAVARAGRHYFDGVHRARSHCLRRIYKGKISPVTDCVRGTGDESLRRVDALRDGIGIPISRHCVGVDLAQLKFPGQCESNGAFGSPELEECVAKGVDDAVADMLQVESPPAGALPPFSLPCVTAVGRRGHSMVKHELRARERCLLEQDRGSGFGASLTCRDPLPPYGPGTGMDDADNTIIAGYVSVLAGIPAGCKLARPDRMGFDDDCEDLTGGRFTSFDLKLCVFENHKDSAARIIDTAFPREAACGNGEVEGSEECDDGNTTPGDGCNERCVREICGDGVVQTGLGEQCDNGQANSNTKPDACRTNCKNPSCGDKVVDSGEACDPPNGTTCSATCTALLCGNGNLDSGEECDNGAANSDTTPDACRTNCKLPRCGDGVTDPSNSEACDDGNTSQTDACLNDCKAAKCGDGFVRAGVEECDDGNTTQTDACLNDCKAAKCGDGFVRAGVEDCDDGNTTQTDTCLNTCKAAKCGDGFVCSAAACTTGPSGGAESCDAGTGNSDTTPNACRKNCALAHCGDGVVDNGEQCDGPSGSCPGGGACGAACTCANECPGLGEIMVISGDGRVCAGDEECPAGSCINGRCRTDSRLDTGMSGLAHGSDITDGVIVRGFLTCGGSFPCGVCEVEGIDASTRACRCANNNRTICNDPFSADPSECPPVCDRGAAITQPCTTNADCPDDPDANEVGRCSTDDACACYFGPPLALSSGNTPACIVNRFAEDFFGTADVDAGSGSITTNLRSIVFLGEELARPCPYCVGDPVPNDGERGGTCVLGENADDSCDVDAYNTSFPAPGGAGHSIDCFPYHAKNVSGLGLRINLTQSTSRQELKISGDAICGYPNFPTLRKPCWCMQCSGDPAVSCTTHAECEALGVGTCSSTGGTSPSARINQCDDEVCVAVEGGEILGECSTGPDDKFCDGILRANGEGFVQCLTNADCSPLNIGIEGGVCTLLKRRPCFLDPIVAVGAPNPSTPLGAATFCVPPTGSAAINQVAGIPGPARVVTQARSRLFCSNDPTKEYTPGVGGCEN